MESLIIILIAAILVEAIWEAIKQPLGASLDWLEDQTMFRVGKVGAAAVGITICVIAEVNLFEILGLDLNPPTIGYIFTGLIVARGSNAVHDLLDRLQGEEFYQILELEEGEE